MTIAHARRDTDKYDIIIGGLLRSDTIVVLVVSGAHN